MISRGNFFASLALCLALCLSFAHSINAQDESAEAPFDFYTRGPYRASVPRPQSILRYDVGNFHTNYALMERVVTSIADAAPDRMRVTDIGQTNEYRQMHLVVISAPENLQRLDTIKANIARLSDPRSLAANDARSIVEQTPLVVWLNYTIHGNESASFEAMMQVVYQLAASEEPATLDMLRNCVVLVNVANPDGHERFVTWYNSNALGNPEPLAGEHREPWSVYGRVNRFRFDLNRDNIASTQVETRNMQRAYLEWNPQVFVDLHGQPSQYFFPPAALPINPNLPPEQTARWLTAFGRANAAEFDRRAWSFYVRDIFDLFYPGYWDSWPSLNGATGMTYETDGGGFKGLRWRRDDGSIATLRSAIAKHFVTSLATLTTAATNRAARLNDYYEFRRTATEEGRRERLRRVVLPPASSDPGRVAELVEVLLRAGIEVRVTRAPFRATRAHAYGDINSSASAREFPAGSIVIDLAQPQKRLAKALLEPDTPQDESFMREQLARFARNERRSRNGTREEYSFYDVTAWSLPFVFGVEAFWTEDAPEINAEQFRLVANQGAATSGAMSNEMMSATNPRSLIRSGVTGGRAQVAYLIPYDRNAAGALALRLQQEDFRLAVATRPLSANGREWPRGTIVARVGRNSERLHERIAQLATELGVEVTAVNTGYTETGEVSVGSETVVSLRRPRIIVVADDPVDQTSYGAMWWMFDRYGIEFTPMTVSALRRAELDRYNVIILPDGSPGGYFAAFGESGIATLRGWCQRGGTLVAVKGAAVFAAIKEVNLTSARLVGSDDDEEGRRAANTEAQASPSPSPQTEGGNTAEQAAARRGSQQTATEQRQIEANQTERLEGVAPMLPPIASPSSRPGQVPEPVPGAIMRATIDRTTPMTYGYDNATLPVLVNSGYFFRPSREGTNAVVFSSGSPAETFRIAGFIWPNNTERLLRNTTYVFEESVGRGHVVLYSEDPNFRGFWFSTTRLFFNSFLFQL